MYRELHEEVGLTPDDVDIVHESKQWYQYTIPKRYIRPTSTICGQSQRWFLLRLLTDESMIDVSAHISPEFDAYRWIHPNTAIEEIVSFKREVYKKVMAEFFLPLRS